MLQFIYKSRAMKTQSIIVLTLIAFILLSCSGSDSDEENLNSSSIVGVWKPYLSTYVCSSGDDDNYIFSICEQKSRYEFSENGALSYLEFDHSQSSGACEEMEETYGTYSQTGDNLILTWNNGAINNLTILELSSANLKLSALKPNDLCEDGSNLNENYMELRRVK